MRLIAKLDAFTDLIKLLIDPQKSALQVFKVLILILRPLHILFQNSPLILYILVINTKNILMIFTLTQLFLLFPFGYDNFRP